MHHKKSANGSFSTPVSYRRVSGSFAGRRLYETTLIGKSDGGTHLRALLPEFDGEDAQTFNAYFHTLALSYFACISKNAPRRDPYRSALIHVLPDADLKEKGKCSLAIRAITRSASGNERIAQTRLWFDRSTLIFRRAPFLTKAQKNSILLAHFRKR